MKRKRAPGGGRKARAGPTSPLTFRIPDDLRQQLESEAAEKNATVSERLLWHLSQSLSREKALGRDPAVRAFCFLIMELSDRLRWAAGPPPALWERNPFVFKAFKIAVEKLLSNFEPKGDMKRPPIEAFLKEAFSDYHSILTPSMKRLMAEVWESPERAADDAVQNTLLDLAGLRSPEAFIRYWTEQEDKGLGEIASRHIKKFNRTWYGMADVRHDLQISLHIERPKGKSR